MTLLNQLSAHFNFSLSVGTLSSFLYQLIILFLIVFSGFIVFFISKKFLFGFLHSLVKRSENKWDDLLIEHGITTRLNYIFPGLVIYFFIDHFYQQQTLSHHLLTSLSLSYIIIISIWVIDAFLTFICTCLNQLNQHQTVAIKSIIQIIKLLLYLIGLIFICSIFLNKSPWAFVSGLGAITALSLLVFKDTITGFVSSIKLSFNNMVQVGDWIEMPKYGADGDVIDITLTSVKVQNWDKTITTIPTYLLVEDSFKNWRGMSQSGSRRIKLTFFINMASMQFCNASLLKQLSTLPSVAPYLKKRADAKQKTTNSGAFRQYLTRYLRNHPHIHLDMTLMVRYLPPTDRGLPIQIYCFSKIQDWIAYEKLQSDIIEHILSSMDFFKLNAYQLPSGKDLEAISSF